MAYSTVNGKSHMPVTLKYIPLPGKRCIRILILKAAPKLDSPILCDMENAYLRDINMNYVALSYSWGMNEGGDATLSREIEVNGHLMPVTQNLFEALTRIRKIDHDMRLWVDAVCINQEDIRERNEQVGIMAVIYERADKTIAWLGEGEQEEDEATYHLVQRSAWARSVHQSSSEQRLTRMWSSLRLFVSTMHAEVCNDCGNESCPCYNSIILTCSEPSSWTESVNLLRQLTPSFLHYLYSDINKMRPLFMRRYWSRRWIVQELKSSMFYTIRWGRFETSDITFERILEVVVDVLEMIKIANAQHGEQTAFPPHLDEITLRVNGLSSLWRIDRGELPRNPSLYQAVALGQADLANLLANCVTLECSDPRDKLYSLLSILNRLDRDLQLHADYGLTTAQTYTKFAQLLLQTNRWSWVLTNIRRINSRTENLPSWVPDLNSEALAVPLMTCLPAPNREIHFHDDGSMTIRVYYMMTVRGSVLQPNQAVTASYSPRHEFYPRPVFDFNKHWKGYFHSSGHCAVRPGDKIYALDKEFVKSRDGSEILLVLRPTAHDSNRYEVVTTLDVEFAAHRRGRSTKHILPEHDRMMVRIV